MCTWYVASGDWGAGGPEALEERVLLGPGVQLLQPHTGALHLGSPMALLPWEEHFCGALAQVSLGHRHTGGQEAGQGCFIYSVKRISYTRLLNMLNITQRQTVNNQPIVLLFEITDYYQ